MSKVRVALELEFDEEMLREFGLTVQDASDKLRLVESDTSDAYKIGPVFPNIDPISEFFMKGAEIIKKEIVAAQANLKPQNVSDEMLKRAIFMERDVFMALIEELTGDDDAVYIEEGTVSIMSEVQGALEEHFGITITSIHADGFDTVGIWIIYSKKRDLLLGLFFVFYWNQ